MYSQMSLFGTVIQKGTDSTQHQRYKGSLGKVTQVPFGNVIHQTILCIEHDSAADMTFDHGKIRLREVCGARNRQQVCAACEALQFSQRHRWTRTKFRKMLVDVAQNATLRNEAIDKCAVFTVEDSGAVRVTWGKDVEHGGQR